MDDMDKKQEQEFEIILKKIDGSIVVMRTYRDALQRIAEGDPHPRLTAVVALEKGTSFDG